MQAADVVVSDTSPLLGLALIDRLDLVRKQFSVIVVPEQVWTELTAGEDGVAERQSLRDDGALDVVSVDETALFTEFRRTLDEGEAAALAHAIEKDADLVLLDEREARQAARRHELPVTGAIGILLRAAENGDIDLQSELEALCPSVREYLPLDVLIEDDRHRRVSHSISSGVSASSRAASIRCSRRVRAAAISAGCS